MDYLKDLKYQQESYYQKLIKNDEFILFGASKVGKNACKYLTDKGKKVKYFCDNDKQKWGKKILGVEIVSPDMLSSLAINTPVLITSSFHKEIKEQLINMNIKDIYYVYKFGRDAGFYDSEQIFKNREKINNLNEILSDEKSREILEKLLQFRYTQDYSLLEEINKEEQYYPENIINLQDDEIFVDAGAYNGNTVIQFVKKSRGNYRKIYTFEPDNNNFVDMGKRLKEYEINKVEMIQKGLSNKKNSVKFDGSQLAGSKIDENGNEIIETIDLDSFNLQGNMFIKMDIEGEELNALIGSKQTIIKNKPKLAICIYHKSEDLWTIPLYIKELVPEYKIYIRHHSSTPWETVCYATL